MRELYYNCDQISEIYETLTNKPMNLAEYKPLTEPIINELLDLLLLTFPKNVCRI